MYIKDDICYAGELIDNIKISNFKYIGNSILLVTFSTGEERLFDTTLLTEPVFEPLRDENILKDITLFHGILTWLDGSIDIAPETVYTMSFPYDSSYRIAM